MKQITAEELKNKLDSKEDIVIVDVREPWEYEEQQLHPSTKNYPLAQLPHLLDELAPMKDSPFVVHCRSGARSNQAQKYLTKNGFNQVINLVGGIEGFRIDDF